MKIPVDRTWIILEKEDYADYLFVIPPWQGFTIVSPGFGFENANWLSAEYISEGCTLFMTEDSFYHISKKFMEKIFTNPKVWEKLHKENLYWADETFKFGKKLMKTKVIGLSNKELMRMIRRLEKLQIENHCRRGPMFIIEVKENLLSKYLSEYLHERRKDVGAKTPVSEAFQVLSTPTKRSTLKKEQEELLRIGRMKGSEREKALKRHAKKYAWLEYGLLGKVLDYSHFKEELKTIKPDVMNEISRIRKRQKVIVKEYKIHSNHRRIFNIVKESIYVKAYSKDAQFFSYYAAQHLFKDIAKRTGLTLKQLRFLIFDEYELALNGKDMSKLADSRQKYSIHFSNRGKTQYFHGIKAKQIKKKLRFVRDDISQHTEELKGSTAYPGKVKGVVKIINTTQEMMKMHPGNVLVSHMTNPDIVRVMKIAAAIVTDLGGITCHAAIVSRELKTPCVTGTKIATQVLKDGDVVEVDADKGIVRKLK